MIVILAYIVNLLAAITNPLGLIGLVGCVAMGDFHILPIAGMAAAVGLVFGIVAYRRDIPPRWYWAKSANDIFAFSVGAVLGYAWNFACFVGTYYLVELVIYW